MDPSRDSERVSIPREEQLLLELHQTKEQLAESQAKMKKLFTMYKKNKHATNADPELTRDLEAKKTQISHLESELGNFLYYLLLMVKNY